MDVSTAIKQRISTRGFVSTPLAESDVRAWLTDAQRAPSGGNLQPWRVIALSGAEKDGVVAMASEKLAQNPTGEPTDYPIYPEVMSDAQKARRYQVGHMMYEKIGIPREDKAGRRMWFARNYNFFNDRKRYCKRRLCSSN